MSCREGAIKYPTNKIYFSCVTIKGYGWFRIILALIDSGKIYVYPPVIHTDIMLTQLL